MNLPENLIEQIRDGSIDALMQACAETRAQLRDHPSWEEQDYQALTEFYAVLIEALETKKITIDVPYFEYSGDKDQDCPEIFKILEVVESQCSKESSIARFKKLRSQIKITLQNSFCYEFSQGDLERVQSLINQLRDLVASCGELEQGHRQRLLSRLESLQSELHKKISDLDRFWGLVGDASVVLAKIGNNAKPIVDRVREITDIIWQTQSRTEELPSGTKPPLLEHHQE
ncbi:hypothetical protein [Aquipseudomonas alcaligenes]|uniref:hypothetical protein n=1 Tax=Aquipseudomonas alcaligenes TaxID=43263 RepID=UPI00165917BB|nr:hypothetical protein [Pseudomonas alcaligenes]